MKASSTNHIHLKVYLQQLDLTQNILTY